MSGLFYPHVASFTNAYYSHRCVIVDNEKVLDDLLENASSGTTIMNFEPLWMMLTILLIGLDHYI